MVSPNWDEISVSVTDLSDLKYRMHRQVVESLDLSVVSKLDPELLKTELSNLVGHLLEQESAPLNIREREQLITEIQHEVLGLGPLEPTDRSLSHSICLLSPSWTRNCSKRN